jgi:hypothetical protein
VVGVVGAVEAEAAEPFELPVTMVAAQLGHSRTSLTLDVYSHVVKRRVGGGSQGVRIEVLTGA